MKHLNDMVAKSHYTTSGKPTEEQAHAFSILRAWEEDENDHRSPGKIINDASLARKAGEAKLERSGEMH